MKLYIAPNEKKTAAEVSEALGKTTKLSLSDSYSQDGQGILKRSISRRNGSSSVRGSTVRRSLPPLPLRTRISPRAKSTSFTRKR